MLGVESCMGGVCAEEYADLLGPFVDREKPWRYQEKLVAPREPAKLAGKKLLLRKIKGRQDNMSLQQENLASGLRLLRRRKKSK